MPRTGLNIAQSAGEGGAPILNWDMFNTTIGNIYQRDLNNLKSIRAQYDKLNMQMGEASSKLRPADMPKFKENYDKFHTAMIMLESSKIRNNPQEQAHWKEQMDQAFFDNASWANTSEQNAKFKTDVWKNVAEHPENYYDYDHLKDVDKLYDTLPSDQLAKVGLNTQVPWMHPANAYPVEELDKHILGVPKTSERREPVYDATGKRKMGDNVFSQEYYQKTPSEIARNTAFGLQQVWSASKQWHQKYDYDSKNQPEVVISTLQKAQEIIDADPNNGGYKLGDGFADYAAANFILQSQPRDVGTRHYEEDPHWKEYEQQQMKYEEQQFRKSLIPLQQEAQLQRQKDFYKFKNQNGLNFSGGEMYQAAMNPSGQFSWNKGGQTRTGTGADLLDSRLSEITAKTAKGIDYVILDRQSILDPVKRRRLVDKLFGYQSATKDLYDWGAAAYLPDNAKIGKFLDQLRKPQEQGGLGMDFNENDLNVANPIIINNDKGWKMPIKMGTTNYDKFTSQISQLMMQDKPVPDIEDDYDNDNYLQFIQTAPYYNK